MAPLVGATAYYVKRLNSSQREIRQKFTLNYQNCDLLYHPPNSNQIYLAIDRNGSDIVRKMQVIWTPEGRCIGGKIYDVVDGADLRKFDAARFEKG
ncbi:hypothetical protein C1J03_21140 [Sulfitobacter sp. SK012]|uniref:hypothetical protein n=1 Tax=Sulfitobacter sp. SK012 TaxID=1389005 RepID=UPI000E0C4D82|nr:hypothetical protein [Sulfitobacter sp. SK012]AXI48276.1 hypothetical protein C1J03_21140 [Sulfitobacter sp. SK012]